MWTKTSEQAPEEEKPLLFFDSKTNQCRIMKVVKSYNDTKYMVSDANLFFGYETDRFTHWQELPKCP